MVKECNKCGEEKPLTSGNFHRNKRSPNGFRNECKECNKKYYKQYYEDVKEKKEEYRKRWRKNNKEGISEYNKFYRESNKGKLKKYREANKEIIARNQKEYRKDNKEKINFYFKKRKREDYQYRLKCNLRTRLHHALKGENKSETTMELLGCSTEFLKRHLEVQFTEGMTWANYGVKGWHIDHIKPCASFDLSDPDQQKECFHYTNLQPLWSEDNIRKKDKLSFMDKLS